MSREIKFRAWDKGIEEMIDIVELCFRDGAVIGAILDAEKEEVVEYIDGFARTETNSFWEPGDFVLMQFTGLKDKNGVEIYEGDVVLSTPQSGSCGIIGSVNGVSVNPRIVTWLDDAKFGWRLMNGCLEQSGFSMCKSNAETIFEVIGNIHENKGLL